MHPRLRLVLIGAFACLFAAFIAVWAATYLAAGDSGLQRERAAGFTGAARPPGAKVPAFRLRDQDGRVVSPALHRGKPAVYAFIYSTCEDVCPVEVQQIRGAMDQLGRDVPVIGVSVDPEGDTPARARRFLLEQHMTGRMRFALGTAEELRPVWKAFGVQPQTATEDHSASVVLVDQRGFQRVGYAFSFLRVDGLEADLRRIGA